MTDPISDLLTRIRNAQTAGHESVRVPLSKIKLEIVKILCDEGFLGSHRLNDEKEIEIKLRYKGYKGKDPLIVDLSRRSRSGRRVYVSYREIRPVRNGMGIAILSTPRGVMTDRKAREEKVGGELLCTIW